MELFDLIISYSQKYVQSIFSLESSGSLKFPLKLPSLPAISILSDLIYVNYLDLLENLSLF